VPLTPSAFDYLDYRRFLDDWFSARKAANPRFSHRLFARLAGHSSPSLLLQVIQGKRNLSEETLDGFLAALKLDPEEGLFFRLLVRLDQAANSDDKNAAWQEVSASRRFREARSLEGEAFEYISHWYCVAVRELAQRADFVPDPVWIAEQLRPSIAPGEAERALGMLRRLGLLREVEGRLGPADASVVTPHEVAGLAARNYHAGMLRLAAESIERFGPRERHLSAVTVCIPASLVPRLKAEIDAFQERVLDLCDSAEGPRDQVHQVQMALFPLSGVRAP
jgi:uncharacterized protein (TIGR02147 family)